MTAQRAFSRTDVLSSHYRSGGSCDCRNGPHLSTDCVAEPPRQEPYFPVEHLRAENNYDGSGTPARINWEERFARGGVGAIIAAHVPVHVRGRILPNYAFIDRDSLVPFWRLVGERVHRHDCKFILQLSHAGRQQ